jgi:hypothetical protein
MNEDLERHDSIAAAARLASSARARAVAGWVAAFVIMPAAGWIGAKLDARLQVDELTGRVRELSGNVAVLTSQQQDLVKAIDALSAAPGGPIFQLRTDMRYAHRNAVRATAVALSGARTAKLRLSAAEPLLQAYDRKVERDGKSPSDAAEIVISQVAVQ